MTKWILGVALALLVSAPAFAGLVVPSPIGTGCRTWILCDAEASAGICDDASSVDNYMVAGPEYTWTAFSQPSPSVAAYTVKLYSSEHGGGVDATNRALINSSDITFTNQMFSWNGIMGDIHAVVGGTLTGGVTIVIKGCALTRP